MIVVRLSLTAPSRSGSRLFRIFKAYRITRRHGIRSISSYLARNRVQSALDILVTMVVLIIESGAFLVLQAEHVHGREYRQRRGCDLVGMRRIQGFFSHADCAMKLMAGLIWRPAGEIMVVIGEEKKGDRKGPVKVGRNDPCFCGSGPSNPGVARLGGRSEFLRDVAAFIGFS